jgi:hypothetical protein
MGADGAPAENRSCSASAPLIRGEDATESDLAAVGTIGTGSSPQDYQFRCTAALIAPDVVLTAKHCIVRSPQSQIPEAGFLSFAVGSSTDRLQRLIPLADIELLEPDSGGYTGFGGDLALCRLSEPVTEVTPLAVAAGSLAPGDTGQHFTVVGFGTALSDGQTPFPAVRRRGTQTLQALDGNLLERIYGSRSAFLQAEEATSDCAPSYSNSKELEDRYDAAELIAGYEAWFGNGIGDAQTCRGDSGGPLLREETSEIVGVVSWDWHPHTAVCDYGSVYAVFGPETLDAFQRWLAP